MEQVTIQIVEKRYIIVHQKLLPRAKKFAIAPNLEIYTLGAMGKLYDTVNYHAMQECINRGIKLVKLEKWS